MRNGLIISLFLHVGVLVFALGYFPFSATREMPVTKPVPVDLMTASEFTKVKAGSRKAKKEAKAKAALKAKKKALKKKLAIKPKPKKKVVKAKPKKKPVKKVAKVKPAPKPVKKVKAAKPKPAPVKKAKKAKPVKKLKVAKSTPKPVKKKKRIKKVKRSYEDEMAALLNKLPDQAVPEFSGRDDPKAKPDKSRKLSHGRSYGFDAMMSANEIDAFRAQIARCWNPPVGGFGAEALAVKLRLRLRENGKITRPPKLMNRQSSPFFQAAADSAIRAVLQCQPYTMPKAKYNTWKDMVLTFDPREMMGGF